ncbi:hypothetical protein KKI22_00730 [Patescibacteria group bacterium]|nr:hypothetical protein [Patescibacteria group bacterium]
MYKSAKSRLINKILLIIFLAVIASLLVIASIFVFQSVNELKKYNLNIDKTRIASSRGDYLEAKNSLVFAQNIIISSKLLSKLKKADLWLLQELQKTYQDNSNESVEKNSDLIQATKDDQINYIQPNQKVQSKNEKPVTYSKVKCEEQTKRITPDVEKSYRDWWDQFQEARKSLADCSSNEDVLTCDNKHSKHNVEWQNKMNEIIANYKKSLSDCDPNILYEVRFSDYSDIISTSY